MVNLKVRDKNILQVFWCLLVEKEFDCRFNGGEEMSLMGIDMSFNGENSEFGDYDAWV